MTVFGAGAMGSAMAMHLARAGNETILWASEFDAGVLPSLRRDRRHPALPVPLPESLAVMGPEELAAAMDGLDLAVMGAHSGGARTLAQMVAASGSLSLVVGIAKGLEPETGLRMSEVYGGAWGHDRVVSMGGPCLAPEVAEGVPTAAVFAAADVSTARDAAEPFRTGTFRVHVTDDLVGVEYCTVAKNVAAIGMGILDGLGRGTGLQYRNARAALFTQAFEELTDLVVALGGRRGTASGLAGLGDALVTSLGGRNRLFGEMLGEGAAPAAAVEGLQARGMTVEGWDSAREVHRLARESGLGLPFFEQIHRILFDGEPADSVLLCLKG
jgi:glycerol-3-phosphate dehydrogenase (NAD(P)+)